MGSATGRKRAKASEARAAAAASADGLAEAQPTAGAPAAASGAATNNTPRNISNVREDRDNKEKKWGKGWPDDDEDFNRIVDAKQALVDEREMQQAAMTGGGADAAGSRGWKERYYNLKPLTHLLMKPGWLGSAGDLRTGLALLADVADGPGLWLA